MGLELENAALRAIVSKIMPCHYCGVDEIAKCPSGFPGCALADDIMVFEDDLNRVCRQLRETLKFVTNHRLPMLNATVNETLPEDWKAKVAALLE